MSTLDASSEVRSENLTSRNPSLGTVHSRKLLSRIREERFRLPAHNATARFEISLREEERRSENKARCTSRFVSSPFRFSPSAFSRLRASARLCTLRFYLSAAFVPSRCSSLRVGTALARVSGFPKRFPETEMLALAMQALSLVPQRPGDPWLPVITLSLSLSLSFLLTFPPPPPCGTLDFLARCHRRSLSPSFAFCYRTISAEQTFETVILSSLSLPPSLSLSLSLSPSFAPLAAPVFSVCC